MTRNDAPKNPLLEQILDKAGTDRAFRRRLLKDPESTIREVFGTELMPNFRIRFIEKPNDVDLLVVLPDPREDSELSPDVLDEVAGGTDDPLW